MIHIFFGSDEARKERAILGTLETLAEKKEKVNIIRQQGIDITILDIDTLSESQSLFHMGIVLIVSNLKDNKEVWEYAVEKSSSLVSSVNTLILSERTLLKKDQKEFHKDTIFEEYAGKEKFTKSAFNVFSITDSFGERDKRETWLRYREAVERAHIEPREIHGVINWIVKTMMQSYMMSDEDLGAIGVKPFVIGKAKRYAKNFTKPELFQISNSLISLYHRSLRGEIEIEEGLESLLLSSLS